MPSLNVLPYLFFCLGVLSCKSDKKTESTKMTENQKNIKMSGHKEKPAKPERNSRDFVQHFYRANGGSILYMKNGEIKNQARFDTDGDFFAELMKLPTVGTFKYRNDHFEENSQLLKEFFDENGRNTGWQILYGEDIENPMQIASFTTPKNASEKNTDYINKTQIVFIMPETKTFKDENSPEAEAYFTTMDDFNWYMAETRDAFKKIGVEDFGNPKKKYLKFKIGSRNITLDPSKKINGTTVSALLYKKDRWPIIVHLISTDDDWNEIKEYLKN